MAAKELASFSPAMDYFGFKFQLTNWSILVIIMKNWNLVSEYSNIEYHLPLAQERRKNGAGGGSSPWSPPPSS